MKPASFEYKLARSREEAIELLRQGGDDARPLAGGQSLVPLMNLRVARPSLLVDLNQCADLAYISADRDGLHVGAMTRQRTAELDPVVRQSCPMIGVALATAGSPTIRNRGTVGGIIANGYPLAELITAATCLDAIMVVASPAGEKRLRVDEFFCGGMVTAIAPGELLREVVFPAGNAKSRYAFRKTGNHAHGSAAVLVAAYAESSGAGGFSALRIAVGGVDDKPLRCRNLEAAVLATGAQGRWEDAFRVDLAGRAASVDAQDLARTLLRTTLSDLTLEGAGR